MGVEEEEELESLGVMMTMMIGNNSLSCFPTGR